MATLPRSPSLRPPLVESLIAEIKRGWLPENHLKDKSGKPPRRNEQGEILALCPLHKDSNPSLSLNAIKGTFKCHGCGKSGGVLALARELTGERGDVEALCAFADRWGIPLPPALRAAADGTHPRETSRSGTTSTTAPPRTLPGTTSRTDRPTNPRIQSVGPREAWEKCAPVEEGSPTFAYLADRGLDSALTSGEVRTGRVAGSNAPMLAVPLRDLDGVIRDLQFRTIEPKEKRFTRIGGMPEEVGPVIFGRTGAAPILLLVEGMTDYLAAVGPFASASGSVIGIPGATFARGTVEALLRAGKLASTETVVLALDADPSGDKAAGEVRPLLTEEGIAVKRLRPPAHKDLAEWAADLVRSGGDAPAALRAAIEQATSERPFPWMVPAPEFIRTSDSTVRFLIANRVPVGSFVLLQGPPGVGKTWLALLFAREVAEQGKRVALVQQEGPASALAQRLTMMKAAHPNIYVAHRQPVRLDESEWVAKLAKFCWKVRLALLVLDPLAELHQGDENETRDASVITAAVKALQRECPDLAILLLHHTVKNSWGATGAKREHSRGSGVLPSAADVQLGLTELEKTGSGVRFRFEVIKARDFDRPPATDYTLIERDGHMEVQCQEAEKPAAAEREESEADLDRRILALVPSADSASTITVEEIRERAKVGMHKARTAIARLEETGQVEKVPKRGIRRTTAAPSAAPSEVNQ